MLLTIAIAGVAVILLLPTVSDVMSLARVLTRRAAAPSTNLGALQRLLFLVPAHNEELLLAGCVRSLRSQEYTHDRRRIVVIADNCTDRTAAVARAEGAECLERRDPEHPSKPHAIAWALTQLPVQAYDAVVIVDADTIVDPGFAGELNAVGPLRSMAVQAYFGLSNPMESPITRMSAVLAAGIHLYAYQLKQRAGLNVPLVGNGMAVGTEVLATHGWQAFSICEDWEMFALLTANQVRIAGAPRARIYAQEAHSLDESATQRQRWTAGRVAVLFHVGPRLLTRGGIRGHQRLDAIGELASPGPALHLGIVSVLGAAALLFQPAGTGLLLAALAASLLRPAVYALLALAGDSNPLQALRAFVYLPIYVVWRIGNAARAVRLIRNGPWIRTKRHQTGAAETAAGPG